MNNLKKLIISLVTTMLLGATSLYALEIIQYNGDKAYVRVSNNSVNKIVFPSEIVGKSYSKEKGLSVDTYNNQLMVKYKPIQIEKAVVDATGKPTSSQGQSIVYSKAKSAEMFVETKNGSYSLILVPSDIESETIMINDTNSASKDSFAFETKDEYPITIKKLIFAGFDFVNKRSNEDLKNFKISKGNESEYKKDGFIISHKTILIGAPLSVKVYEVFNDNKEIFNINPIKALTKLDFYKQKNISSISILDEEILPGASTYIAIIVRGDEK